MKIENRKRNVQVKFRLTPEESALLNKCVDGSGMNRNDYIIRELITRATIPRLSWEKRYFGNDVEIICKLGKHIAGYARCSMCLGQIQIHNLFVSKTYRNSDLMDKLLDEVYVFAEEKEAGSIQIFCGAEPMTKDGQIPLDQEIAFYERNGFERMKSLFADVPYMVRAMI